MARVKRGLQVHKRHKKLLAQTKGYKLGRRKLVRQAEQAVLKAGQYSYRDRRNKKRVMRRLWIVQLNAAARAHGMSYSQFIAGLHKAQIALDRKVLAQISIQAPTEFGEIAKKVQTALTSEK